MYDRRIRLGLAGIFQPYQFNTLETITRVDGNLRAYMQSQPSALHLIAMTNDPRIEPLLEWNRLARQNAEDAIVSSMFEAGFKASEPMESFSTWLLVGTAAVASFLVTNADKLVPFIKQTGFLACGAFLCFSCLFGLSSKMYALRCKIQIETGAAVRKTFAEQLAKHVQEEAKIQESAATWGITLETGIRLERVLAEFYKPLPRWVAWLANRQVKKHAGNPQLGYFPVIAGLKRQGLFVTLQALTFLGFLVTGFVFAAAI
ncbi:hypothetical protein [Dechloromonas sp. A34]|uniref:hypothetical protein n=1 Tax=Dechloromonas sp. A34 TaxID=447588 RepID=UPI00224898A5|nr:hypothetical protein [Dechloromonas sp. A34]